MNIGHPEFFISATPEIPEIETPELLVLVDFDQKWNRFLLVELPDLLNFFENVSNQSFEWTSKFILISHQIIYEREGTNNLSRSIQCTLGSTRKTRIFWSFLPKFWELLTENGQSKIGYFDESIFCKKICWKSTENSYF